LRKVTPSRASFESDGVFRSVTKSGRIPSQTTTTTWRDSVDACGPAAGAQIQHAIVSFIENRRSEVTQRVVNEVQGG